MPRGVVVTSTDAGFRHEVSIGPHLFAGDELWLELPRKSNWYQMLKGDSNERFKQPARVGATGQEENLLHET